MSGAATGPGPAPGMPGHTAAITPKTWTEGTAGYNANFTSFVVYRDMVKQHRRSW